MLHFECKINIQDFLVDTHTHTHILNIYLTFQNVPPFDVLNVHYFIIVILSLKHFPGMFITQNITRSTDFLCLENTFQTQEFLHE